MLSRGSRLGRDSFEEVRSKGRACHYPLFSIRVLMGTEGSRASVVVSKKVAASAVSRHTLKRRVYTMLRKHMDDWQQPCSVIVFIKPGAKSATRDELTSSLSDALAEIIHKSQTR